MSAGTTVPTSKWLAIRVTGGPFIAPQDTLSDVSFVNKVISRNYPYGFRDDLVGR